MLPIRSKLLNKAKYRMRLAAGVLTVILFVIIQVSFRPGVALASNISDVITGVSTNISNPEYQFGSQNINGMNINLNASMGKYGNGDCSIAVVGPADSSQILGLLDYVAKQAGSDGTKTAAMNGYEVREYRMESGSGIAVILPDYLVTAELYNTSNGRDWELNKVRWLAQLTLDGLASKGVLKTAPKLTPITQSGNDASKSGSVASVANEQSFPQILINKVKDLTDSIWGGEDASTGNGTANQGTPNTEPIKTLDTNNTGGVQNGPTAPTTFTIDKNNLLTYIQVYHWNNGKGVLPGTIGLQNQNGVKYGPWQAKGTPGQGGVPNAYWEVGPNVVIPAGTYTIIDSDPSTWACNSGSGGRGMALVKSTPDFAVTRGSLADLNKSSGGSTGVLNKGNNSGGRTETQAGIGSVGNIPGPATPTQAVVGASLPGLISIALGALGALGTGGGSGPIGGMQMPPGGGAGPGGSGSYPEGPNQGRGGNGALNSAAVTGKRPDEDGYDDRGIGQGILVDPNLDDYEGLSAGGIMIDSVDDTSMKVTGREQIFIDDAASAKVNGQEQIFIDEATSAKVIGREQIFISKDIPGTGTALGGILIDTNAIAGDAVEQGTILTDDLTNDFNPSGTVEVESSDSANLKEAGQGHIEKTGTLAAEKSVGCEYDASGFDKQGYDSEGYNQAGYNPEGFNRDGYNAQGFNQDGFNHQGVDAKGYNREGYDANGNNLNGSSHSTYDGNGFDKNGFDRNGFNKDGLDKEGYNREGLNPVGYNREGYGKDGYDKDGYNQEGYDSKGLQKEGYDEFGYDKNGFNKDGNDRDGYDLKGIDYKGYNREGYDLFGYDRQGYGKDGYHWSGYNAEGYDRTGRLWSEQPKGGTSPNPFDEDAVIIIGEWKPTKPALGEPYPKTVAEYGPKTWGDSTPTTDTHAASGDAIGGNSSGIKMVSTADPTLSSAPLPEGLEISGGGTIGKSAGSASAGGGGIIPPDDGNVSVTGGTVPPDDGNNIPLGSGGNIGPIDGQTQTLVGKTDGRTYEVKYDGKTGQWINTESGSIFDPKYFDGYQDNLAANKQFSANEMDKMIDRTDGNSVAIDQHMADLAKLQQMEKIADKYDIGTSGGPGDVDKAIQDLKQDLMNGKEIDHDKMDLINRVIKGNIRGDWTEDTGARWEEDPWYTDIGSALKANAETMKEVVTGSKEDGSTAWLGIGARIMLGTATGGVTEYGFTIAEAMAGIQAGVDKDESSFKIIGKAIGKVVLDEGVSRYLEGVLSGASSVAMDELLERFPALTNTVADYIEAGILKGMKANQAVSAKLGFIGKEGAEDTINQINKHLAGLEAGAAAAGMVKGAGNVADDAAQAIGHTVEGAADDVAQGAGKGVAGSSDDISEAAVKGAAGSGDETADALESVRKRLENSDDFNRLTPEQQNRLVNDAVGRQKAQEAVSNKIDGFDDLPANRQEELVTQQQIYDEYRVQTEENTWKLADKLQRGEPITVDDVLNMKADPASMRTMKDMEHVDGLGTELGIGGVHQTQTEFNNVINQQVYRPSYDDVESHLAARYGGAEIRVQTVRTPKPGQECHPWDINTDNDIVAQRLIDGPNGPEWVEIPPSEWEDVYFKSYAQNTNFNTNTASARFPDENWNGMSPEQQYRRWGELHGESPTDVYSMEGARDFSTQRTAILNGESPGVATSGQAAQGQGTLIDSEGLGLMEKNKVNHYWEEGTMNSQTEALEQLRKTGEQAMNLEQGYKCMGYKVADMPNDMQKAIAVINDRSLSPTTRMVQLQELGYETPGDFAEKLTSRIGALRIASPQ